METWPYQGWSHVSLSPFILRVPLDPAEAGPRQVAPRTGNPKGAESPILVLGRLVRHVAVPQTSGSPIASTTNEEGHSSAPASAAHLEGPADSETTSNGDPRRTNGNHQDILRGQLNKALYPHGGK
ncbi:uncharacterized protein ACBT57_000061 [Dama dama]